MARDLDFKLRYIHELMLRMITFMLERGLWAVSDKALEEKEEDPFEVKGRATGFEGLKGPLFFPHKLTPSDDLRSGSEILMD